MLRAFGRFSRKVRSVAGDFQRQVDDALREAELDDVRKSINDVRSLDPRKAITDKLNPLKDDIERDLEIDPILDHEDGEFEGEKPKSKGRDSGAEAKSAPSKSDETAKFANSGKNAVPGFEEEAEKPAKAQA